MKFYRNYLWSQGVPQGIEKTDSPKGLAYKIVTDPYRKRFTLEEYREGAFQGVIYDSLLLDFRHLTPKDQLAWEREIVGQEAIIRDIHDRVTILESYRYENDYCRECIFRSPHGLLLAKQKISYEGLGDPFNGVTLYDTLGKVVLRKTYAVDASGTFTDLISACDGSADQRRS